MPTDITDIVTAIPDSQPASVTMIDSSGKKRQLDCVFKESKAPSFFLLFAPGMIPEDIQKDWRCVLFSKDLDGEPISFSAKIIELANNRVIELVARKSIRPEDLREFFRINLRMPIEIFYEPEDGDDDKQLFELTGETVDISQTGVLSILSGECSIEKPVSIELSLPNPAATIICSGNAIRCKRLKNDRWLTSFHFNNLSSRSRDIIAKNCFAAQRKQLRENIKTAS